MIKATLLILLTFAFSFSAQADFEAGEISTLRQWTAEVVSVHSVWQKPACLSYTKSQDEESTLEVISFYDEESKQFTEPTINILTPFEVSFFEVVVEIDGISDDFSFLPVLPDTDSLEVVGARALFDDRQDLVESLRRRNRVTANYLDATGEVKSIVFSLSGSSQTLQSQFEACGLEINERETLQALPLP